MKIPLRVHTPLLATLCNIALAYIVFMLCRVLYVWENWSLFAPGWGALQTGDLLRGSLRFDSSAFFYTNALYLILMLLPCLPKERNWWHTMTKWVYVVINSLVVIVNLSDSVYSQYTGRRTTATFFHEFSNEGNLGTIFFTELLNHWYLVLAGAALIALLWLLYTKPAQPAGEPPLCRRSFARWRYYIPQSIAFVLLFPVAVIAMRGGATRTTRPITIANANQYVNQPHEAAIVLNTPFSVIRTLGKTTFADPHYMDEATLRQTFTPLHLPEAAALDTTLRGRNVVVIILESFGREYTGFFNKGLEDGTYKGYTPFLDSLLSVSLTWEQTYDNGRKSIDAMPSILSSLPMFVEPFVVTNYSLNRISGLAEELGKVGYSSAFFHGADNSSMGFQAFARSTGFQAYYGRTEFDEDPRFGGEKEHDGTWAIWDEPFLQFYAMKMSEMREPFITAVFTASSHHPFNIPEKYVERFPDEALPIHRCIRYSDNALRQFFATASRQPWFHNTLFVITNDHTNQTNHDQYRTSIGVFSGPILIYDPSGVLPAAVMPGIAQQIDIMPTLLGLLAYPNPYVAFGKDLLRTAPEEGWTVNYSSGIYQYLKGDTLIQFDGEQVTAAFDLRNDPLQQKPLREWPQMHERRLQAIIQQYMARMVNDELTVEE